MQPDLVAFLNAKGAAGLSPLTLHWYSMFIDQYLDWSMLCRLDTKKPETVEGFLAAMRLRKLSPFTISGCYTALSVYFKWLVQRRRLRTSPMALVQRPKVPKQRKRHITPHQFARLYQAITGDTWLDFRDRAILQLLFYSGLRANEVLGLRLESIDREHRMVHVAAGKGGQDRDVPCAPDAIEQIDNYLMRRPGEHEELFMACAGIMELARGPLTSSGLSQMVRRRCEVAGVPRHGPHAFRHGFAMHFLNDGEMELAAVSKTMGHSSTDVTRRFYADFETVSLRRKYDAALDRISNP